MHLSEVKNTALLLFTRSAEEEAIAKDFSDVHAFHSNLLIAQNLISHSEKTARDSGLPCFTISSHLQTGNSFGEKLANAFAGIYQLGFENVIAIGNDCPTLTHKDLHQAAFNLQNKDAVIGPAKDGGLYLIGLNRNFLITPLFENIPWGTRNVSTAFVQYLNTINANYTISEKKSDLDHSSDILQVIQNKFLPFTFRNNICAIFASIKSFKSAFSGNLIASLFRKYTLFRGPPVV